MSERRLSQKARPSVTKYDVAFFFIMIEEVT